MPSHVVISLMSRDRVGIIAAVAKSIFALGGTIGAISQTVMDEYFTILLTADFAGDPSLDAVRQGLEAAGARRASFMYRSGSVKARSHGSRRPATATASCSPSRAGTGPTSSAAYPPILQDGPSISSIFLPIHRAMLSF